MMLWINRNSARAHASIGKFYLGFVLLINLVYFGWISIRWGWLDFQKQSPNIDPSAFVDQFILSAACMTALIGLLFSRWSRNVNLIFCVIFFAMMVMIDWGEYTHDKELAFDGNIRGALDRLRLSAFFLTANLWAIGYLLFAKFKTQKINITKAG